MHTDPQLTAFALDDTSLTPAERSAIESRLARDPALRAEVDEIRWFGGLMTRTLTQDVAVATQLPAINKPTPVKKQPRKWLFQPWELGVLTTLVLLVGIVIGIQQPQAKSEQVKIKYYTLRGLDHDEIPDFDIPKELANVTPVEQPADYQKAILKPEITMLENYKKEATNGTLPGSSTHSGTTTVTGGSLTKSGAGTITLSSGIPQTYNRTVTVTEMRTKVDQEKAIAKLTTHYSLASLQPQGNELNANVPDVQLRILEAQRKEKLESGVKKDHPIVKAIESQIDFWKEIKTKEEHEASGNSYRQLVENKFITVKGEDALSTFGVDVDTASYSLIRNYLNRNTMPPPDAVRLEEMINYFPYTDKGPEGKDPYAVHVEVAECPWQTKHRLARIAVKARAIDKGKRPPSNLVFLIDVSGSMNVDNRLPLVKESLKLLVNQLGENDKVAIVVYAGASGLVLNSTNCNNKKPILDALDKLESGGSTNGGAGIELAYLIAANNYIEKGTNRVILCTDGDWNVGTTTTTALTTLIEEKRKTNVFLSVFGFGMGNLRDEMLVQLSNKGNGNYAYIDTISEAKKQFVEQLSSTLVTVAKDVKIQIEFNPAQFAAYRLIGYEKRILAAKDFKNDKIDAGEMGAGHTVVALYELVPTEKAPEVKKDDKTNELRYQTTIAPKPVEGNVGKESFVIKLRHKEIEKDTATQRDQPFTDPMKKDKPSDDFQFTAAVAAFGLTLKQSEYRGNATYDLAAELAKGAMKHDPGEYRLEFLGLVTKARELTKK